MSVIAKSVVFDIADNLGSAAATGIRDISFSLLGVKVDLIKDTNFTTYVSSPPEQPYYATEFAFDSPSGLTGTATNSSWRTATSSPIRLIIVFNTLQEFDSIDINNYHEQGTLTTLGVKNVKITSSLDAIIDTTYDAAITNSTVLSNSELWYHASADVENTQNVFSFSPVVAVGILAKSVVFDIADNWGGNYTGIRDISFSLRGVKIDLLKDIDFTAFCGADTLSPSTHMYDEELVFDSSKESLIGFPAGMAWISSENVPMRLVISFNSLQDIDTVSVNNFHSVGAYTDWGARNVKITVTTSQFPDNTYNGTIDNPTELSNNAWPIHVAADVEDTQIPFSDAPPPPSTLEVSGILGLFGAFEISTAMQVNGYMGLSGNLDLVQEDVVVTGSLGLSGTIVSKFTPKYISGSLGLVCSIEVYTINNTIIGSLGLSGGMNMLTDPPRLISGRIGLSGLVNILRINEDVSIIGSLGLSGSALVSTDDISCSLPAFNSDRWC